jgi:hypothetical protein
MSGKDKRRTMTIKWDGVEYKVSMPEGTSIDDAIAALRKLHPDFDTGYSTFDEVARPKMDEKDNDKPRPWPLDST